MSTKIRAHHTFKWIHRIVIVPNRWDPRILRSHLNAISNRIQSTDIFRKLRTVRISLPTNSNKLKGRQANQLRHRLWQIQTFFLLPPLMFFRRRWHKKNTNQTFRNTSSKVEFCRSRDSQSPWSLISNIYKIPSRHARQKPPNR